jgi:hypothetical protein
VVVWFVKGQGTEGHHAWLVGQGHVTAGHLVWLVMVGSCDSKAAFLIGGTVQRFESKVDVYGILFFVKGYWVWPWYTVYSLYTYPHAWNNKKEEYQAVMLLSDLVPLLPPAIEWRRAWTWYTKSRKTKREGRKYRCFSWREMGKDPKPDDRKKTLVPFLIFPLLCLLQAGIQQTFCLFFNDVHMFMQ